MVTTMLLEADGDSSVTCDGDIPTVHRSNSQTLSKYQYTHHSNEFNPTPSNINETAPKYVRRSLTVTPTFLACKKNQSIINMKTKQTKTKISDRIDPISCLLFVVWLSCAILLGILSSKQNKQTKHYTIILEKQDKTRQDRTVLKRHLLLLLLLLLLLRF